MTVKSEDEEEPEASGGRDVGDEKRAGSTLRVSMRLSNEMPEFVVLERKYAEAVGAQWRSEMHIQMAFMEEPGEFGSALFCFFVDRTACFAG